MITVFGYIHPINLLYLLDTLHHIFRAIVDSVASFWC